jgi:uncharacterized membrane protein (UPF0127 family)
MDAGKQRILLSLGLIAAVAVLGALTLARTERQASAPAATASTSVSDIASATTTVSDIAPAPFQFEIVTDSDAQARGLGGRADIPHDYGMLFVFQKDDFYGFWMKDMLVPIDMIWLSDNGTVVKVDANVSPSTYPDVFYPPQPVRYVLETRAGEAAAKGWGIGVRVPIPLQ